MNDPEGITVMAVDNLPCELPRDASHGFGKDMMAHVIPLLVGGDRDNMLTNATETTLEGALAPKIQSTSKTTSTRREAVEPRASLRHKQVGQTPLLLGRSL